ncbi:hypothetical protein [Pseudomonas phage PIP]|nr:hypothetical protein [Pseudomonas phage PIP]
MQASATIVVAGTLSVIIGLTTSVRDWLSATSVASSVQQVQVEFKDPSVLSRITRVAWYRAHAGSRQRSLHPAQSERWLSTSGPLRMASAVDALPVL